MRHHDEAIKAALDERLAALERHFRADVVFYYGEIHPAFIKVVRDFVEKLVDGDGKRAKELVFFLNTPGGSAETVEKLVEIVRFHYRKVSFVVPDQAMSAGTILCMSGDRIFMDYSSSLGPIDPQVYNGKEWVPALGYLDKVEQLLEKARQNTLTNAEFLILQGQDLALLSRFEQARDLTVTLLKRWLVEYKFKDWKSHQTNKTKLGKPVTQLEKEERAEEIARILGDNKLWHSHGRMIGVDRLQKLLRLRIDDYSRNPDFQRLVRSYNDLLIDYITRMSFPIFLHSRNYF